MIGLVLFLAAVTLVTNTAVRDRSLPMATLAASFVVFYGVRAFGVGLGIDSPYPEYLFRGTDMHRSLDWFGAMVLLFCVSLVFAYRVTADLAAAVSSLLPLPRRKISLSPRMVMMLLFTVIATGIALLQIATYGGFDGAIVAAKSDRESGGAILRIPATLALVLSASNLYAAPQTIEKLASQRIAQQIAALCLVTAAMAASVWGSRQFMMVAVGYVIGAPAIVAFQNAKRGWFLRAALTLGLVVVAGLALRLYRDDALGGETAVSQADGNLFRQVSISANGTTFDSSILAVRDFPENIDFRAGEDFTTGLWGALPNALRPDRLQFETIGAMFHRLYEPTANNGWPIGAPAEWFINFGWIGVAVGGLLSGVLYRSITIGLQRSPMPQLSTIAALILTLIVFPLGLSSSSANRFVIHVIPLLVLLGGLRLLGDMRPDRDRKSDAGPRCRKTTSRAPFRQL